jgi:hypothetical protein
MATGLFRTVLLGVEVGYLRPAARRSSRSISMAFNAGFRHIIQGWRRRAGGSRTHHGEVDAL